MSRNLFYMVSTVALLGGISAISIAQSSGGDDPYKAYYSSQQAQPQSAMQGGPLAQPMPQSVRQDMGGTTSYTAPAQTQPYSGSTQTYSGGSYSTLKTQAATQSWAPATTAQGTTQSQTYSSGSTYGSYQSAPASQSESTYQQPQYVRGEASQGGSYYQAPQGRAYAPNSGPMEGGPMARPAKKKWWQRLGFGNWQIRSDGYVKGGVAAIDTNETTASSTIDAMVRTEVSTVTQGGTEYGISLKLRGQRDPYHRGFAGSTFVAGQGDCPPNIAGCPRVLFGGTTRGVRGHTGRVYTFGLNEDREHKVALEGAHIFLRSRYGDFTLGRDDGAAALFSLDTPSTLPMARASNMRTDYVGLDMTKTVNDASGFAEKVTYTSPRLLGDTIGVGVQFGLSYAPSTEACGVDYCVRGSNLTNTTSPIAGDFEDAIEFGLSLDRTFTNGARVEAVANYATASETSGIVGFDDLQSWGLGLKGEYGDWAAGANYLSSNNGWAGDGDYTAYDFGLTWKPSQWGVTFGYGGASDDLANSESQSVLLGASYDWTEELTFGTGVQYITRETPVNNAGTVTRESQEGVGLFFEGGFKF